MARELEEESEYYIMSKKAPMPLKWTAPEVKALAISVSGGCVHFTRSHI